jgi:hypothetical protein
MSRMPITIIVIRAMARGRSRPKHTDGCAILEKTKITSKIIIECGFFL